ncbi:MAG TPA: glycosyltransferase [Tepidisphaeraceae bacterium]|nr:glycosyltransferase [Tepidisphaeraceae bacterium]
MKVLFFLHPGTNSRGILVDIIKGFSAAGHSTVVLDTTGIADAITSNRANEVRIRESATQQIAKAITDGQIDMSVGMWANGLTTTISTMAEGRILTLFERLRSPHLLMWLDSPERAHQGTARKAFKDKFFSLPYQFHFINNSETAREMRQVYGFDHVLARHYGVEPEVFKPYPDEPRQYDLAFCAWGGCWKEAPAWVAGELAKDEPDMLALRTAVAQSQRPLRQALVSEFPSALAVAAEATIERLAQMQLERRERPVFYRVSELAADGGEAGEPARLMLREPELYAAVVKQIRRIDMYERAFIFIHLARHFSCALFGDVDYSGMGCPVKSLGNVPYDQQARIYSRAPIGLSVMRWEDDAGFHLKPFEITASGAACVAQERKETQHLFRPETEIVRFRTPGEARRKIRDLLDHPAQLAALAEAGRARTLKDHTWANWARDMTASITQWQTQQKQISERAAA